MDKLNKHIKNVLEDREITPSQEIWSQLDAELDKHAQKPNSYKAYKKLVGIAAVLLLLISVGVLTYKTFDAGDIQNQDNPITFKPVELPEPKNLDVPNSDINSNPYNEKATVKKLTKTSADNSVQEKIVLENNKKTDTLKDEISNSITPEIKLSENNKMPKLSDETGIMMTRDSSRTEKTYVTKNLLLAQIKDTLPTPNPAVMSNPYVTSKHLLTEAEDEIFYQKNETLYEKIKKESEKIQVAIKNRNYEQ